MPRHDIAERSNSIVASAAERRHKTSPCVMLNCEPEEYHGEAVALSVVNARVPGNDAAPLGRPWATGDARSLKQLLTLACHVRSRGGMAVEARTLGGRSLTSAGLPLTFMAAIRLSHYTARVRFLGPCDDL
jgi:hypothetical protein